MIISGAKGYLGTLACDFFQTKGCKVYKASRTPGSDIKFDLSQPEQFSELKINVPIDIFLHTAAANENKCREKPYESISQNVIGTKAALDFCVANDIKYFVYISTFHVFGNHNEEINEDVTPMSRDDYGLSHFQAEQYVKMYTELGYIKGIIIRPSNLFGVPDCLNNFKRWTLVPFAFCKDAVQSKCIVLNSPGLQERNFVSVHDVCEVIYHVIPNIEKYPLLHVPGPETMNIKELAIKVKLIMLNYYNTPIELKLPESNSFSLLSPTKLNFSSMYLDSIYKPSDTIDQHIIQLCGKLRGE